MRLLLVEDNAVYRRRVRRLLGKRGVEVVEAEDLAQALRALETASFDCALVDLNLPDGDGMSLLLVHPELPIVFLTATSEEAVVLQAMRAGAEDFLIKSSLGRDTAGELLLTVRKAIERFRRRRELRLALARLHREEESGGVVTLDRAGMIMDLNEQARALLGRAPGLLSSAFPASLSPASREPFQRQLERAFAGSSPQLELTLDRGHPVMLCFQSLTPSRVQVGLLDLTHPPIPTERGPESELREVVLLCSAEGVIRSCNGLVEPMFCLEPEALLGCPLRALLPDLELAEGHTVWSTFGVPLELTMTRLSSGEWVVVVRDQDNDLGALGDLLEGAEAERRRLGQELHDNLGQRLAAMSFVATSLEQRLRNGCPEEAGQAGRLTELCQQTLAEVRSLSRGLFPADLELGGLAAALRQLGEDLEQIYGVRCRLEIEELSFPPGEPSVHLYRIVQESLQNSIRHGKADRLQVRLGPLGDRILLRVSDNGCGMGARPSNRTPLGLIGMRRHCRMLGGTLEHLPNEPCGTIVRCLFPRFSEDSAR